MSHRQLLRKPFPISSPRGPIPRNGYLFSPRFSSSNPRARIDRVLDRLPRFLRPYTDGLRNAPVSNVLSFLILHELTAVVPLVGLAGLFHYTEWLPKGWVEAKWVREGSERFGRYFGRKGWFGFSRDSTQGTGQGNEVDEGITLEGTEKKWHVGEKGGRILIEVATAYAITKVFLPARILLSVWATPWFARVFVGRIGGLFGRGAGKTGSTSTTIDKTTAKEVAKKIL